MKYAIFLFLLISINSNALDYEIGLSHLKLEQKLFGTIQFDMDLTGINTKVWYGNFGAGVFVAKSNKVENTLTVPGKIYENEIDLFIHTKLMYRYKVGKFSIVPSFGYVNYKTTWWSNGVKPTNWANDHDSDLTYGLSLRYEVNKKSVITFGYTDFYRKNKKGKGKETTKGLFLSVNYRF